MKTRLWTWKKESGWLMLSLGNNEKGADSVKLQPKSS